MRGEVTFPDREPIALDFWTPDPGGEVVVPVKLVRARPAARLVLAIENRRSSPSNLFTVTLERAANDPTPIRRRVELVEGRLHLDGIQPGPYRVSVCASEDPNHPGIYFPSEFELELRSGQTTNRSVRMRHGAGLRVTLRNGDGEFLRGRYELHDNAGDRVKLCLVVADRWQPGSDRWASLSELLPLGIHQSTAPLEPGGYRLDLVSPGYATRRIAVELRAGRYEEVDVTLVR